MTLPGHSFQGLTEPHRAFDHERQTIMFELQRMSGPNYGWITLSRHDTDSEAQEAARALHHDDPKWVNSYRVRSAMTLSEWLDKIMPELRDDDTRTALTHSRWTVQRNGGTWDACNGYGATWAAATAGWVGSPEFVRTVTIMHNERSWTWERSDA